MTGNKAERIDEELGEAFVEVSIRSLLEDVRQLKVKLEAQRVTLNEVNEKLSAVVDRIGW